MQTQIVDCINFSALNFNIQVRWSGCRLNFPKIFRQWMNQFTWLRMRMNERTGHDVEKRRYDNFVWATQLSKGMCCCHLAFEFKWKSSILAVHLFPQKTHTECERESTTLLFLLLRLHQLEIYFCLANLISSWILDSLHIPLVSIPSPVAD